MATAIQTISQIYVGYFNRAPDPAGLNYWVAQLNNGMPLGEIADYFGNEQETLDLYPYLREPELNSVDSFINEVYDNLFNAVPDAAGFAFWKAQLESGAVSTGEFIAEVANGATGVGRLVLDNKVAVGVHFATELSENNVVWNDTALNAAYQALDGVTNDPATVVAANSNTDTFVSTGVWPTGEDATVQLTIGNDVLTANVFDAPLVNTMGQQNVPTLNAGDVLTGVGDNPTLNAVLNGQLALNPVLKGIETLNLETVNTTTLNASRSTGIQAITHEAGEAGADLLVRNLATNATITVNNGAVGGTTDTIIRFADSVVAGADDTATLILNNNGTKQVASGVINLRGETAGGFETIDVTANGVNRLVDLDSNDGGISSLRTLNVDGAGSLRIQNVLERVTTVNASENTGGINVSIDAAVIANVTGGSGNDTVNFGAGLTNADKYDGGEGRDTLQVSNLAGLGAGNQISNVEILRVDGAATGIVDLARVASVDALVHNSTAAVTYNNFSAAGAADAEKGLTILSTGAVNVGVKDAAAGLADTLQVNYGNQDTAANFGAGGLTAANVEIINFNVVESDSGNVVLGTGALAVAQAAQVNFSGGLVGTVFQVNANAAFGGAALSQINAGEFVGNIQVSGNAAAQKIIGGSGDDILATGGRGDATTNGDTLTGGEGRDTFVFAATDSTALVPNAAVAGTFNAQQLALFTSITDLNLGGGNAATGQDSINLNAVNIGFVAGTTVVNAGSVVALTGANFGDAINTVFNAGGALDGINEAGLFSWAGETFLLASSAAGVGYSGGDDIIIRVTGVTGTLDTTDFVV